MATFVGYASKGCDMYCLGEGVESVDVGIIPLEEGLVIEGGGGN